MIRLGMTIKKLRLERGVSQKQLAEEAQLTPSFVSLIEHNRRDPSIAAIARLAAALNVPPEVVIWDAVQIPPHVNEKDRRLCEMAKLIVRRFYESSVDEGPTEKPRGTARRRPRRPR